MKESVAVAKEADAKKRLSPIKSDNSIHRAQNEPERQLGSLRDVIGNIRRDGGKPSVESIAAELSGMPTGERAPALLALQQTHGNRYVQRVVSGIQAKLVVGQPGDMYEREADRVADEVMRVPEPEIQRQEEEEQEEEILLTKPLVDQITPLVQRQVEEEEEEEMLQAKSRADATSDVTNDLESQINAIKGGGRPLAESERAFFEPRFGYDFSRVRVHADAESDRVNQSLNARAFTRSRDIFFRQGTYSPRSRQGRELLAHELTHVLQQSMGNLRRLEDGAGVNQRRNAYEVALRSKSGSHAPSS
jgi:polyhydroxyalkanoate synthesis regulator phasin